MRNLKYKFLDDENIDEIKKKKEKQRIKNLKRAKEYRKKHKKELSIKQKNRENKQRIERKKGNIKRWKELSNNEPKIKQINSRMYQNSKSKNVGKIYTNDINWWYEIENTKGEQIYKSDLFDTKLATIRDLRLIL